MPSLNRIFGPRCTYIPYVTNTFNLPYSVPVKIKGIELKIDYRQLCLFSSEEQHPIPIIACCGWGSGWEGMAPLAFSLACEGFELYLISLPGYGNSDNLPPEFIAPGILDLMADVVIEFCAQMKIPVAYMVGHSMAGAIAMEVAKKKPSLVEKVGLLNPCGINQYYYLFQKISMAKRFILSGAKLHMRYKWQKLLSREDDYILELVAWCGKQKNPFGKDRKRQRIQEFNDICNTHLVQKMDAFASFPPVVFVGGGNDSVFSAEVGRAVLRKACRDRTTFQSSILQDVPHNLTLYHSEVTAAMLGHLLTTEACAERI